MDRDVLSEKEKKNGWNGKQGKEEGIYQYHWHIEIHQSLDIVNTEPTFCALKANSVQH